MPFVTTCEMMKQAQAGGYAIGAFNAENLEMVQAIIAAAEAEKAPVIICRSGMLRSAGKPPGPGCLGSGRHAPGSRKQL